MNYLRAYRRPNLNLPQPKTPDTMPFTAPKMSDVNREGFSLPAKGRKDVVVTAIEASRSSKGDPMLVFTSTIDAGPDAGHTFKEYFAFSESNDVAWARLACICDAAKFEWVEASSLEAFAAQFPLNQLRYSVDIEHAYSIKAFLDSNNKYKYESKSAVKDEDHPYEEWVTVPKQEYDAWEGPSKNVRAQVRDGLDFEDIYQPARTEQELAPGAEAGGDGKAGEPAEEPDDDLPF